ncbi:MAG: hypothetical protein COV51_01100, partial [Gallionellaceae bacterium CG11_big_fil_rev_8_21_14_0_20_60_62]
MSDKTLARHRDHVWLLGGEIVRRRHDDPDLHKQPIATLLSNLIEEEDAPLIWPLVQHCFCKFEFI